MFFKTLFQSQFLFDFDEIKTNTLKSVGARKPMSLSKITIYDQGHIYPREGRTLFLIIDYVKI
jgi:hypothetical protein